MRGPGRSRWARELRELQATEQAELEHDVDELVARARAGVIYAERLWPVSPRPALELEFPDPRLLPERLIESARSRRDGSPASTRDGHGLTVGRLDELLQATMGVTMLGLMVQGITAGIFVRVFERMAALTRAAARE